MKKKKFASWDRVFDWLDLFFVQANMFERLRYLKNGGARGHQLGRNIELRDKHKGQRAFVLGNGPSISQQDIKLLKDEITFFANRAFVHEDYEYIKPTYHTIVDPKLGGEWPLTFLDQAAEKNPDVIFLLNARKSKDPRFREYARRYNIYWLYQNLYFPKNYRRSIDLTRIGPSGAVVEEGITASVYMGVKEIYLTGVEWNHLFFTLVDKSSHFYGNNEEDLSKSYSDKYTDLVMHATSMRRMEYMDSYLKRHGVRLVNLTDGGILDCLERQKYESLFFQGTEHTDMPVNK